ncbi:hypothetical protein DPMN_003928 [Dreissena polymorpha]|uniref:Uncharacterized protein n=1 Tax=Dreissena polymorpha TaxID=45954 RepID=A0A9D4MQT7_DREPO|nr:hypothetical protein DPMN_003928 [Dreissena polymorpha]
MGGQGYQTAGEGAGGRLAIHTWDYNIFKGELWAYTPGGSTIRDGGGPGTVFIEDKKGPFEYQSRLYIDGRNLLIPKPVVVNELNPRHVTDSTQKTTNNANLDFEHLTVQKNAMLEIAAGRENINSINLDYVMGDRTGYLHLANGQTGYVEYSTYATLRSVPPINFHVDVNSNIWLSADFQLIGIQIPAMQLDGHMVGVRNLTLEENVQMFISDTATNSKVVAGQLQPYPAGTLGMGKLAMQANALINHEDFFNMECAYIHMRFSSLISANRINVDAGEILMEGDATFDVSDRGGDGDILSGQGSVVNVSDAQTAGIGGGHGGYGGGADRNVYISGAPYGSFKTPHHTGCKGGGSQPGNGGGRIDINIVMGFHLDGNLFSVGGNARGANSGGGSGGSVHVVTQNFSGHGLIETSGGNGIQYGYGGSGGRTAVHVNWFREYTGSLIAYGGFAGSSVPATDETRNGAGGTIYVTDSNSIGLDKKEVLIVEGKPVYVDGYVRLVIDNDNRNHVLGTMVMSDTGTTPHVFEFNEVNANNHAVLWIEGDKSELIVHKFSGDRTGMMHLSGQQKVWSEYVASTSGYTVAPVSLQDRLWSRDNSTINHHIVGNTQ